MEYSSLLATASVLVVLLLGQSSVFCSTTVDMLVSTAVMATGNETEGTPQPTEKPLGPDDLVLVDYIIIGVTSAMFAGIIIGTIIVVYRGVKKSNKERKELYEDWKKKNVLGVMRDRGHSNSSFESEDHGIRKRASSDNSSHHEADDNIKVKAEVSYGAVVSAISPQQAQSKVTDGEASSKL